MAPRPGSFDRIGVILYTADFKSISVFYINSERGHKNHNICGRFSRTSGRASDKIAFAVQ